MKHVDFYDFNFGGTLKWNQMFESETDLLNHLVDVEISIFENYGCKGYQTVAGLQKAYLHNASLTSAQMTQLKRLAREIYKYHKRY